MPSTKETLRAELLARRRGLSQTDIQLSSTEIARQLDAVPAIKNTQHLAAYWPVLGEVDIRLWLMRYLSHGHVYLPRYDAQKDRFELCPADNFEVLVQGKFGVWEPPPTRTPLSQDQINTLIQTWLVPGIAFDRRGNRIGLGKGYYDRLLAHTQGTKIGLAYAFQVVSALPNDPHDVPMDIIITSSEILAAATP